MRYRIVFVWDRFEVQRSMDGADWYTSTFHDDYKEALAELYRNCSNQSIVVAHTDG